MPSIIFARNETDTTRKDLQDALLSTILQFAKEQSATGLVQKLLKETAVMFDTEYFRDQISKGKWDTLESYLMKFTRIEDNRKSARTFFLLKRQKFLEAMADNDVEEAENVLESELQAFDSSQKKLLENLSSILSQKKPRGNILVSEVIKDLNASRTKLADEAVKLIRENSKFHRKLEPPKMEKSRLLNIIHQSIGWQHSKCENPREKTIVRSLYIDHNCDQSDETPYPSSIPTLLLENTPAPQAASPLHIGATTVEMPPNEEAVPVCIDSESPAETITVPSAPTRKSRLFSEVPSVKRKSPAAKTKKSGRASKRQRDEEGSNSQANETVQQDPNPLHEVHLADELPTDIVMFLPHDSHVESLDFHPSNDSLLLCGTAAGDIVLWELCSNKKLVQKSFRFWDLENISTFKKFKTKQEVNKVKWNSDGVYFVVAFKECLVHVYSYLGNGNLKEHTEINAHQGLVHDVSFTNNGDELWVITCGDDETLKVWEALSGDLRFCIDSLKDQVGSVYPQQFRGQPAIYAGCEGSVKIWLYNDKKCKKTIRLPKSVVPCIAYSADGERFFAGGSSDGNESCIIEFSSTGRDAIKQVYEGLASDHEGYVYYDIAKGKYLAAIHEYKIKFWNMDEDKLLEEIDAGGELSDSSYIKFNTEGSLLAVTTKDNGINILANESGKRFLKVKENGVFEAPSAAGVTERILGSRSMFTSRMTKESTGLSNTSTLKVINDCRQCFSKIIPNEFSKKTAQASWLGYTKSGCAILVLGSNGEHKLWEWPKTAENPNGKASPKSEPKLFQAPEQKKMVNDVGANPEGHVSCFALPNNRHYVLSSSGGRVSVYDIKTFKNIAKIMLPPPVATALAIHPKDSNTFLFGMEDSSIQIYNIRTKQVLLKLEGHTNKVTGISYSDDLNLFVSSDADCQLCTWSIEEQKMLGNATLDLPHGQASDTRVQFHKDQGYLLAVHKTQIAIYEAPELRFVKKWVSENAESLITHAAYSCDCESIFVTFRNGSVGVLNASSLHLKCRINPAAFIPPPALSQALYPLVVAAHPSEPNQFSLGLSDGAVVVLEPKDGTWGTPCPDDNEDGPSESPGFIDLDLLVWDEEKDT